MFDKDIIFQYGEAFKRSLTSKQYLKSLLVLLLRQTHFSPEPKSEDCFSFVKKMSKNDEN